MSDVTDDVIERTARVLAQLEPGEEWPNNAALGGSPTGTRGDEFRDSMLDLARDLARAGLLAGGVRGGAFHPGDLAYRPVDVVDVRGDQVQIACGSALEWVDIDTLRPAPARVAGTTDTDG